MDLRSLPKIELHLHLDCSLSYRAVSTLEPYVTHEEYRRDYIAPARCANLADFLSRAPKGFRLMQTEDSLRLVTEDIFQQLVDDGVIYAEIRFAPLLHTARGLSPEGVVAVVESAVERLIRETGMQAGLILCTLRHFTEAQSMLTAKLVEKFRGSRVVALDLAGDEAGYPLHAHIAAYGYAREHGLFRTAHAGEALGPESVWETLRLLDPQRIGHGTRSIEDPKLVEHLRRKRIHLEICPSANVQIIPSIGSMEEHPIDRLYCAGVSLNVNSDSRMLTPTNLTREYESLQRVFNWTEQDLLRANLMGLDAAFAVEGVKQRLRKHLLEAYGESASPALPGQCSASPSGWHFRINRMPIRLGGRALHKPNRVYSAVFKLGLNHRPAVFGPAGGCLYNSRMPNRAYVSIWVRDFNEENMLSHFEHFLATVPLATSPPGFTGMTIRAVDFTETPLEEYDLRGYLTTPEEIANLAKDHHSGDVCYEVAARWDLWIRDKESASWKLQPERMDIFAYGPEYDQGVFAESGHFMADLGFEHLFTGHAGLLAAESGRVAEPQHPEEARFLMWMSQPQNLREYQEKTRENIQKLMGWMRAVEEALPVERFRLWSEGEENFEARLDEILAVR